LAKDLKYFHERFSALRNAWDELLREMESELVDNGAARVPQQKRRNIKKELVQAIERDFDLGRWRKYKTKPR
jgi:hypothetical protein